MWGKTLWLAKSAFYMTATFDMIFMWKCWLLFWGIPKLTSVHFFQSFPNPGSSSDELSSGKSSQLPTRSLHLYLLLVHKLRKHEIVFVFSHKLWYFLWITIYEDFREDPNVYHWCHLPSWCHYWWKVTDSTPAHRFSLKEVILTGTGR